MPEPIPNLDNVNYRNHIVIGLGGTGGKVLRELRKDIFRRHGGAAVPGIRMQYLYVDSSRADLDNTTDWKVLGRSVQLPTNSRLSIEVPDMLSIIDNAVAYPGIAPWLGPRDLWQEYLSALQGLKAAGGQRRRLGRVLFAHSIGAFNGAIASHYNEVVVGGNQGEAGNSGVTFHVVCGLAGGTGSGSVVDAVTQIGHFISSRKRTSVDRIVVYCYLPETDPPGSRAEKYYFANGYAALLELNALSAGRYLPHNLAGNRPFAVGEFMPFNGCYVFSNETESGTNYHADDVPALLAGFLYQKIIAVGDSGAWNALVRAENSENGLPDCEPRMSPDGRRPMPERSVRFMAFGIKRIAIPEEEILEYLTYSYARDAIRQLRFNNWSPQWGFLDRIRNDDFASYRKDETLAGFRCSWNHLILSRAILRVDDRNNWLEIDEYWQAFLAEVVEDVVSNVDKKFWLTELRTIVNEQLEKEYRGDGLGDFYQGKKKTIANEAREIVQLIETHLMTALLDGSLSATEIAGSKQEDASFAGIVEVIRDELKARLGKCSEKAEAQRKQAKQIQEALSEIETQSSKVWIFDPLNRRHTLFEEFKQALQDWVVARTKSEGYAYASELIGMVLAQLDALGGQVSDLVAGFNNLFNEFEQEISKRCTDGDKPDFTKLYVKYYNAESVKGLANRLRLDETLMRAQCSIVRARMVEKLGFDKDKPSFKAFNDALTGEALAGLMAEACSAQCRKDHDAVLQDARDRLFGVDLVSRLLQNYRTASQQDELAKRLVPQATTLAALDDMERRNITANPDTPSIIRRSISVIGKGLGGEALPEAKELQVSLRGAVPVEAGEMHFIPAVLHPNEVVLVSLTNLMPLRCVKRVGFLRGKYEELLGSASGGKSDAMFLHSQGDGSEFSPLFALSMKEVRRKGCQLLLEAAGCDLLLSSGAQGPLPVLVYRELDENGIATDTNLGTDLPASLDVLTPDMFSRIQVGVVAALAKVDKASFLKRVAEALKVIQARDNVGAEDRSEFLAAYQRMKSIP